MGRMFASHIMRGLSPNDTLAIANRTVSRMDDFAREHPRVLATGDFAKACDGADVAILAVSPMASRDVLGTVASALKPSCTLVSFVADLSLANIEKYFAGKVMRLVPTITSYVDRGITLAALGREADERDLERVRSLMTPPLDCQIVPDAELNDWALVTSCGPGIVSSILAELARAYARAGNLEAGMVERMVAETAAAACEYAAMSGKTFERVLSEVATKGGITETGASIIARDAGPVFDDMTAAMRAKHHARGANIDELFANVTA